MTKLEILDYVVDYYKTHPRATEMSLDGSFIGCRYITTNGHRCAHSICIDDDKVGEVQRFSTEEGGALALDVINKFGDEVHKPEFRGHGINFWRNVQSFHDMTGNWRLTATGNDLSEAGVEMFNALKERYKNN